MKNNKSSGENFRALVEISIERSGIFTRTEAVKCGYQPQNLGPMVKSGKIEKLGHGLYRLKDIPKSKFFDLAALSVWGRGRTGSGDISSVIISHASALAFHQLGDFMARHPVDVTVVGNLKITTKSPFPVKKHRDSGLGLAMTEWRDGFRVSAPLRALIETFKLGTYDVESVNAAAIDAFRRGNIERKDLEEHRKVIPGFIFKLLSSL